MELPLELVDQLLDELGVERGNDDTHGEQECQEPEPGWTLPDHIKARIEELKHT